MKRILLPILGIAIVIITAMEVHAMRQTRAAKNAPPPIAAGEPSRISAEGRVVTYPGAEVLVGSDVAGTIERLAVNEKDVVHKGDVLAVIKADDTRAALAQARSRVGEADADIRLYASESARWQKLFEQDIASRSAWDRAERDVDAARARRASAVAEVARLEAMLAKTSIVAPIDGVIIERVASRGESVAAGAPIVRIADLTRTRIEAEIDEFDAARVALGKAVDISAEGFDGRQWRGTIEEIPDAVVSRRIKPQDPSKPIDTRVLLVKVAMAEATPLKLGQRVEVEIR